MMTLLDNMTMIVLLGFTLSSGTFVHAGPMMGVATRRNNIELRGTTGSRQRHRNLQMDRNDDDDFGRCPTETSLLHCDNPNENYAIPCDWETCLWDVSALTARSPPDFCVGLSIADPQADIADVLEPCAIWSLMYGEHQSSSPTTSAAPLGATLVPVPAPVTNVATTVPSTTTAKITEAPVASKTVTAPVAKEPVMPPTADGIVYVPDESAYEVTFDTILINFFAQSSLSLEATTDVFMTRDSNLWYELNNITQSHILNHIRSELDDTDASYIMSVATNFSSLTIQEPWNNGTILVSETLSGVVTIHEDYGMPRRDATTNMVKEAFERDVAMQQYLSDLRMASDPTLQEIDSLYLGLPSEVIDSTTISTGTEPPTTADSANAEEKDNMLKEFSDSIEWGDWSNTYFIIFVAVVGSVIFMMCSVIALCYCLRRRVQKRRKEHRDLAMKVSEETSHDIVSPENTENTESSPPRMIALSPSKTTPMEDSNSKSSEYAHLPEAPKMYNPVGGRYVEAEPSEYDDDIQSDVYSYIDTNTVDDHCYSVAGALMYNPHIPGDDHHSVNWSVAGRTAAMGGADTINNPSQTVNELHLTPQRTNTTNNSGMNLSSMLSESNASNDNVVIFCDSALEDDSVSLINDSLIHNTTLDHTEQPSDKNYDGTMMSSKHSNKNAMSTNARVAAVVAKLEGKTLLSNSFSTHTSQTERTTNKNMNEEEDGKEHFKSSGSRGEVTEEGSPSSEESVALSSYATMPYQNDRQAAITANREAEPKLTKGTDAARSKVAKGTNGKSVRGKSSFFRSTSTGTAENSKTWGIPTGESTNENNDNASDERKKGFWARTQANRNSKATQMVLGNASSPSNDSVPKSAAVTSPTEPFISPVASPSANDDDHNNFLPVQQVKLFEQYEESESDIQSICTYDDDRSYFSYNKSGHNKGSTQLTDQERTSLGKRLPPVTNHHSSYIQSMYKKH